MSRPIIYTIGHSTHQLDYFLDLLRRYSINCLVDIRSVPASAYNNQFNKEPFRAFLRKNDIYYLTFADEFGARKTDSDLLDKNRQLDFEKVRNSLLFKQGVERIWQGIEKKFVIAIMCSEAEPLDCHRFSMVSVGLENEGIEVRHILKDKSCKPHKELEKDLLAQYEKVLPQNDLFVRDVTLEDQLAVAYKMKNKEIGYLPFSNEKEESAHD